MRWFCKDWRFRWAPLPIDSPKVLRKNKAEEAGRKMIRNAVLRGALALGLILSFGLAATAQQQQPPAYTRPEYDAFQACRTEQNLQARITCLDGFREKFPKSTLMPYADQTTFLTYVELKNFPKVIEWADKLLAQNIDDGTRLTALYHRAFSFHNVFNDRDANADRMAEAALKAARDGLAALDKLAKPENMDAQTFEEQKKGPKSLFQYTVGLTTFHLKQYDEAIQYLNTAIENNPNDGVSYFRLGVAYLQKEPAQHREGFWALAKAIALKAPGEAQVRAYLRSQLVRYQLNGCDPLIDVQMNELIEKAAINGRQPGDFHIYTSAELQATREEVGANFMQALKAGGDTGKKTYYAFCGLEFPEVFGKVIAVEEGNDSVVLKLFLGETQEETEAGAEPNMEVKVVEQPETKRLAGQKDWAVRFSGTLSNYSSEPFMVFWTKAKINPEDIPEEAAQPGKARRPGKKGGR